MLFGHEPKPCRELTTRAEYPGVADGRGKRRSSDEANTRNGLQPTACRIGSMPCEQLDLNRTDLLAQRVDHAGDQQ